MSDSFTEVSSEGLFSQLGGAIKGVFVGLLLIPIAIGLLFWNEGRTVKREKDLAEGRGGVVEAKADKVDSAMNGKLVHVAGRATTDEVLTDSEFGVEVNAIKLRREVEMYQWQEKSETKTEKKLGGKKEKTTTYTYSKGWSSSPQKTSSFKKPEGHQNPDSWLYENQNWTASKVTLGAYTLSSSQISGIGGETTLEVGGTVASTTPATPATAATPANPNACPECAKELKSPAGVKQHMKDKHGKDWSPDAVAATPATPATPAGSSASNGRTPIPGGYYIGAGTMQSPQVGDLKVSWKVVEPADISVVAQQQGESFVPYKTQTGQTLTLQAMGIQTPDQMFTAAEEANALMKWLLRFGGFILMTIGFTMIFKPLSVVGDVIPFVGSLVAAGFGIVSALLAGAISMVTIAIGWIAYRPLIGITLLAVAVALIVGLVMLAMKASAAKKAEAAPAA